MKTYRWRWHFEIGGRKQETKGRAVPVVGEDELPLPLKLPLPIEETRDKVWQASWESFPASDAPTWRGQESVG